MSLSFLKLLPVIAAIAVVAGSFFYGVHIGKGKQKIIYQEKIIEAGQRHVEIEKKQGQIRANRSNIDIIAILQSGEF